MRFPIPERFSPRSIFLFAGLIFVGQQIEGTDLLFSLLTVAFILIWAAAFNVAGGIEYPSGAFIFFNGLLTVVAGLTIKIFFWQPGERNLLAPRTTMFCYCIGMAAMGVAALVSSGLRPKKAMLKGFANLEQMKHGAITCLILAIVLSAGSTVNASGSLGSALAQINRFPFMAIILGTTYEIQRTQGKRSLNWIVWIAMAQSTGLGLVYFTKEGMLIGPITWLLTGVLNRFSFSKRQLAICLVGFAFMIYYLVPYSQYVRNFGGETRAENVAVAIHYLSDLNGTRQIYLDAIADVDINDEPHLYDKREGFLDRLFILAPDDALIDFTEKGNVFGLEPTYQSYANIIPHFIWHGKKVYNGGNMYAHELGLLAEEDVATGISFSPVADVFHQAKWLGLMLLLPVVAFIAFLIMDSVAGSAKYSVWAFLPILEVTHVASEVGVGGMVYLSTYWVIAILFVYWSTRVATPFILSILQKNRIAPVLTPSSTVGVPWPPVDPRSL